MKNKKNKSNTIFIIEDNLILSMIINRLVTSLGYEVLGDAKSGEEAVEMIKSLQPDIVLTDVRLDGIMNGIETVKKASLYTDFQTIFISGSADDYERINAEQVGYIEYLLKPVRKIDLANALQKAENLFRNNARKSTANFALDN